MAEWPNSLMARQARDFASGRRASSGPPGWGPAGGGRPTSRLCRCAVNPDNAIEISPAYKSSFTLIRTAHRARGRARPVSAPIDGAAAAARAGPGAAAHHPRRCSQPQEAPARYHNARCVAPVSEGLRAAPWTPAMRRRRPTPAATYRHTPTPLPPRQRLRLELHTRTVTHRRQTVINQGSVRGGQARAGCPVPRAGCKGGRGASRTWLAE